MNGFCAPSDVSATTGEFNSAMVMQSTRRAARLPASSGDQAATSAKVHIDLDSTVMTESAVEDYAISDRPTDKIDLHQVFKFAESACMINELHIVGSPMPWPILECRA